MSKADKELARIQRDLKAPKGQFNSFGKYNYRSCEDILEAAKPLLSNAVLTLSDTIVEVGGRVYVKATATLCVDNDAVETTAFAREPENKKGMDASQVTGAASSYARKYALNGLFCIDDTKDADSTNTHSKATTAKPNKDWAALINQYESLAQLKALWASMPADEKRKHEELKNDARSVLEGAK